MDAWVLRSMPGQTSSERADLTESCKQVLHGVDTHSQDLLTDIYGLNRKIGKISSDSVSPQ